VGQPRHQTLFLVDARCRRRRAWQPHDERPAEPDHHVVRTCGINQMQWKGRPLRHLCAQQPTQEDLVDVDLVVVQLDDSHTPH
jgi:hypothetical protein